MIFVVLVLSSPPLLATLVLLTLALRSLLLSPPGWVVGMEIACGVHDAELDAPFTVHAIGVVEVLKEGQQMKAQK